MFCTTSYPDNCLQKVPCQAQMTICTSTLDSILKQDAVMISMVECGEGVRYRGEFHNCRGPFVEIWGKMKIQGLLHWGQSDSSTSFLNSVGVCGILRRHWLLIFRVRKCLLELCGNKMFLCSDFPVVCFNKQNRTAHYTLGAYLSKRPIWLMWTSVFSLDILTILSEISFRFQTHFSLLDNCSFGHGPQPSCSFWISSNSLYRLSNVWVSATIDLCNAPSRSLSLRGAKHASKPQHSKIGRSCTLVLSRSALKSSISAMAEHVKV